MTTPPAVGGNRQGRKRRWIGGQIRTNEPGESNAPPCGGSHRGSRSLIEGVETYPASGLGVKRSKSSTASAAEVPGRESTMAIEQGVRLPPPRGSGRAQYCASATRHVPEAQYCARPGERARVRTK